MKNIYITGYIGNIDGIIDAVANAAGTRVERLAAYMDAIFLESGGAAEVFIDGIAPRRALTIPTALDATDVHDTSFTVNWVPIDNATSYELDIFSGSEGSPEYVAGYEGYVIPGRGTSSYIVPAGTLLGGTIYFYRLRAKNAREESGDSNTISFSSSE